MSKLFVFLFICFSTFCIAQKTNLLVEGTAPDLFISHKVTSGESLFSVARKYNQTVQTLAALNTLPLDKGLLIGQTIKVPVNAQNLAANGKAEEGETLTPLYHVVEKSETLFRISNNVNAPLEDVRHWNNLSSDKITLGTQLIVGYLKNTDNKTAVQKDVPSTTENAIAKIESSDLQKQPVKEVKEEQPIATDMKPAEKKQEAVVPPVITEQKKEEPMVAAPKVEEKNATIIPETEEKNQEMVPVKTDSQSLVIKTEITPTINDKPLQQETARLKDEPKKLDLLAPEPEQSNEGVFSAFYSSAVAEKSLTNKMGDAATFKSTSGWQDKKYYVLINDVSPGTILKIASADNKVIFAKVLGNMPEMKENKGLMLRLSSAAASYLGMVDAKFPVQVTFYQ